MTRILILGASGMLGQSLFHYFGRRPDRCTVFGAVRRRPARWPWSGLGTLVDSIDALDIDSVARALREARPQLVLNCIGVVKQLAAASDPLTAIPVNSLFPHRLASLCRLAGARLVHVSTDCVFDGARGGYTEDDPPSASDLYGLSKYLGEVREPDCLTLRTSIIGHELHSAVGLVEWFLAQKGPVRGYALAIYSGFPTVELARIIEEHVMPAPDLNGLYHVSSDAISKYDLLELVKQAYGRPTVIERDETVRIDRSLRSEKFREATGFRPRPWRQMVEQMHEEYQQMRKARG
jgi:dTDP-4-dehydrorhamnose reductase